MVILTCQTSFGALVVLLSFMSFCLSLWSERGTKCDPICLCSHFLCIFVFHLDLCGAFDIAPQLDVSHAINDYEGALLLKRIG